MKKLVIVALLLAMALSGTVYKRPGSNSGNNNGNPTPRYCDPLDCWGF